MARIQRIAILCSIFILLTTTVAAASDMRCGDSYPKIGERAYLVQQQCGEPVSKNLVGYTINQNQRRELVIEEWIYGPRDGGYYYIITFVGGRVTKIESERL